MGTHIDLSFAGKTTQCLVEKANDPPAYGAEHDLVPRNSESYVKNFVPLSLGVIPLAKGIDQLKLRAIHFPEAKVVDNAASAPVDSPNKDTVEAKEAGIEVRMLILRRVP